MDQPPPSGNPQLSAHLDHNRFVGRTRVAYFSMEIAIAPEMPTYSGGPGILAGDTARAAADLDLPIVFVTLISRAGYLRQELDAAGHQADVADPWDPQLWAHPLPAMVAVPIAQRAVWVRPRAARPAVPAFPKWRAVAGDARAGRVPHGRSQPQRDRHSRAGRWGLQYASNSVPSLVRDRSDRRPRTPPGSRTSPSPIGRDRQANRVRHAGGDHFPSALDFRAQQYDKNSTA